MAFNIRDVETYRRDANTGGKLLTPEERMKLMKPYLPSPRNTSRVELKTPGKKPRFGARRFLKKQFHVLVFVLIHTFFSLYLKMRYAYHAVANRIYSVFHHHHRTPQLIQGDVKGLRKLPKHLSVILTLENDGRGGAGLERLINEAADVAAWCASAGIPQLSIYEKTGLLKGYLPEAHRSISQKLAAYFGPQFPTLTLGAPHLLEVETSVSSRTGRMKSGTMTHLSVLLLSAEDGRDSLVDLTKTLAEMSQRSKLSSADISAELVDAELSESVMGEPDLLDNQGVEYQVFYRALCNFAGAQMRLGR